MRKYVFAQKEMVHFKVHFRHRTILPSDFELHQKQATLTRIFGQMFFTISRVHHNSE